LIYESASYAGVNSVNVVNLRYNGYMFIYSQIGIPRVQTHRLVKYPFRPHQRNVRVAGDAKNTVRGIFA